MLAEEIIIPNQIGVEIIKVNIKCLVIENEYGIMPHRLDRTIVVNKAVMKLYEKTRFFVKVWLTWFSISLITK